MGPSDHQNTPDASARAGFHNLGKRRKPKLVPGTPEGTGRVDNLAELLGEREVNLRQVILRAHRAMNCLIADKFSERGFTEIKPAHLTLLANMNLGETPVSELAERAQMTFEGMELLAADLNRLGYLDFSNVSSAPDNVVSFTDQGWELMLTSFNIQRDIETECKAVLQENDLEHLRRILGSMFIKV